MARVSAPDMQPGHHTLLLSLSGDRVAPASRTLYHWVQGGEEGIMDRLGRIAVQFRSAR
jgi:hypothetical protein